MTEEMDEKQFMEKFGLQSFGVVTGLTIPEKNVCDGKLVLLELETSRRETIKIAFVAMKEDLEKIGLALITCAKCM